MNKLFAAVTVSVFLIAPIFVSAQSMTSGTYAIQTDSVNFGGGNSVSSSYGLESTAGEVATGDLSGVTYAAHIGYQAMLNAVATDTVPPTAPPSINAVALSFDRVEVTWGQSTDDVGVTGYKIYRDGVAVIDVATFPRDFVDTGLTASTTYVYTVTALDAAGNESLPSLSSSVTTLGLPATVTSGSGSVSGVGSSNSNTLYNFSIIPSENKALVSFGTYSSAKITLSYGLDTLYSMGTLTENAPGTNHSFIIKDLTPSTTYHLKIVINAENGSIRTLEDIVFTTTAMPTSVLPPNATHFKAVSDGTNINLSWVLPVKADITSVRVVRSTSFYPATPDDGEVVFEGLAQNAVDTNAKKGVQYYYSLFTEDFSGNFSSGVVTDGRILLPGELPATTTPLQNLPHATNVAPEIAALTLKDFLFVQNGDSLPLNDDMVLIDGNKNLEVALMYYKVPAVLKTIAVTLVTEGTDPQSFTFILKANADKTRYEATIAPLGVTAMYAMHLTVVDFKNQGLKSIDGRLNVAVAIAALPKTTSEQNRTLIEMLLILLLLVILAVVTSLKKKKDEEKPVNPQMA
jgi:fibronectin type 3 domain-containing protein